MRKFRGWSKAAKEMRILTDLHFDKNGDLIGVSTAETPNGEIVMSWAYEVMQYTGLKDKNGKEIYEGDILYHRSFVSWSREDGDSYKDIYVEVIWGHGGFSIKKVRDEHFTTFDWTRYEVIGNIYENPELLEEAI